MPAKQQEIRESYGILLCVVHWTPAVNEGDSESEWMSPASYRPLMMEERKSLGTAERIRLTGEILLVALFTGLAEN